MRGTTWSPIACSFAQYVMVPSVSSPASRSISGASAATRIGIGGSAPGTTSIASTRKNSPWCETYPVPANAARRNSTYSRVCAAGRSYSSPYIPSITTACDGPMPRATRPFAAACADNACWAIARGWRE